jgi:hypothetical protein
MSLSQNCPRAACAGPWQHLRAPVACGAGGLSFLVSPAGRRPREWDCPHQNAPQKKPPAAAGGKFNREDRAGVTPRSGANDHAKFRGRRGRMGPTPPPICAHWEERGAEFKRPGASTPPASSNGFPRPRQPADTREPLARAAVISTPRIA